MPATVLGPIGELKAHAVGYAVEGLEVFPLNADKTPRTTNGMKDATSDPLVVEAWWEMWPDSLIGCRVPADMVVIDVDPKHNGMTTWKLLKETFGDLPVTRSHKSGRNDGGGHLWFRRPFGKLSVKELNFWAKEHNTGEVAGKNSWTSGIDILHHDHRYTILPPSPHPVTGAPYHWIDGRGLSTDPAEMPAWLAYRLVEAPELPKTPREPVEPDANSIADWFSANVPWHEILEPEEWTLVEGDGDSDGSQWRHPTATQASSASIRNGCLFVYCVDEGTMALTKRGWLSVDDFLESDELLALDPETNRIIWSPLIALNVFPSRPRTLLRMRHSRFDSLTTPHHRWLMHGSGSRGGHHTLERAKTHFETTAGLRKDSRWRRIITDGGIYSHPTVKLYSDEFVELIGWVVTEGTYASVGNGIQVAQSNKHNPQYVQRLRNLADHFRGLGATTSEYVRSTQWGPIHSFYFGKGISKDIRAAAPDKDLAPKFLLNLTPTQHDLLFTTLMRGDGHVDVYGRQIWAQKDRRRLDGFSMLCALLGRRTRESFHPTSGCTTVNIYRSHEVYSENLAWIEEPYDGRVWCPTTATGTWFARHNGFTFWTGNSSNTDFEVTADGDAHGYTPFAAFAVLRHGGDQRAAAHDARRMHDEDWAFSGLDPAVFTCPEIRAVPEVVTSKAEVEDDGKLIWERWWARERSEDDWVIEPLIPRGRQIALWATHKTGKSLITLELAAALATGRSCLGMARRDPMLVAYFDLEMTDDDLQDRLEDMGYDPSSDLENLCYYPLPNHPPLDTPQGGRWMAGIVERRKPVLVILDTMARVVAGEENSADTYRDYYRHTGRFLKEHGVAVLRLDHGGKDEGLGQRGSSAKGDDVDIVWQLKRTESGLQFNRSVSRLAGIPSSVDLLRHDSGDLHHTIVKGSVPEGTTVLVEQLDRLGLDLTISRRSARSALKKASIECRNEVLGHALRLRKEKARNFEDIL